MVKTSFFSESLLLFYILFSFASYLLFCRGTLFKMILKIGGTQEKSRGALLCKSHSESRILGDVSVT